MLLGAFAGVVVICLAGFSCAAVAGHHLAAIAAEQLGGQHIFFLASASCWGSFVLVQDALYPIKELILNNAGHTAGRFFPFVKISADVALIAQQTVQAVLVELPTK